MEKIKTTLKESIGYSIMFVLLSAVFYVLTNLVEGRKDGLIFSILLLYLSAMLFVLAGITFLQYFKDKTDVAKKETISLHIYNAYVIVFYIIAFPVWIAYCITDSNPKLKSVLNKFGNKIGTIVSEFIVLYFSILGGHGIYILLNNIFNISDLEINSQYLDGGTIILLVWGVAIYLIYRLELWLWRILYKIAEKETMPAEDMAKIRKHFEIVYFAVLTVVTIVLKLCKNLPEDLQILQPVKNVFDIFVGVTVFKRFKKDKSNQSGKSNKSDENKEISENNKSSENDKNDESDKGNESDRSEKCDEKEKNHKTDKKQSKRPKR
ncbi:MAG: hypothetical protein K6G24_08595 [Lachnospiraceae bacterium]|nr:hypothetical protein [Lachnospiraceae bacterium]